MKLVALSYSNRLSSHESQTRKTDYNCQILFLVYYMKLILK
jgi:hypothetical protein